MKQKLVIVLTLVVFLLMTGVAFGWTVKNCSINYVEQSDTGIYINFTDENSWTVEKKVSTDAGVEKSILAVALTAQAGTNKVNIIIVGGDIVGIISFTQ
jgi:hypothetical protein